MKSYGVSIKIESLTYNFHVDTPSDVRSVIQGATATITDASVYEETSTGNRKLSEGELLSLLLAK